MSVTKKSFGVLSDGREVSLYHLENSSGAYVEISDFGGFLVSICVPDKNGVLTDVALGYDDLASYVKNASYFGAVIGRNGNRIANATFTIDGKRYQLAANENENNLHSGPDGFEKKLFTVVEIDDHNSQVTLRYLSPDGEGGFPGNFDALVKYSFGEDNALSIHYSAVSDEATIANMTNHVYFNLDGEGSGLIEDQYLKIDAKCFNPVIDAKSIPTGENRPVEGTVFDFTSFRKIGERINADDEQLKFTGGYDHNYVIGDSSTGEVRGIATAYSEKSGILMEVLTDTPCVQFYAGNFIVEQDGKNGHHYGRRHGFCLETQVEPNAVNMPEFHSPVIAAGEKYDSETIYRFRIRK